MEKTYRNYSNVNDKVIETYKFNHQYQTYDYVTKIKEEYMKFDKGIFGIWEVIELSNNIVDESDPDIQLPQIYHYFQTAENVRKLYPDNEEMHLVGLIHDLGKVMLLEEFGGLEQWSVVGDTYPLGCQFSGKIIYSEFFDANHDKYSKYGVYEKNCGLDSVTFSWSHDEYLYQVLKNNKECTLSDYAMKVIRYHSFYAFHHEGEYLYLANEEDIKLKDTLYNFSRCDLYSKDNNNKLNIDELKTYYKHLINKYCPGVFEW